MPAIPRDLKAAALSNLQRKKLRLLGQSSEPLIVKMGEFAFTLDDIVREINLESEEGMRQALIWSKSEEDVVAEIERCKRIVSKAGL
jgi:hypothetical protein